MATAERGHWNRRERERETEAAGAAENGQSEEAPSIKNERARG